MNFIESTNLFLQFLQNGLPTIAEMTRGEQKPKNIGIVVTPWQFTSVPWYAITFALIYWHKGFTPYIIWDDLILMDSKEDEMQNAIIDTVLKKVEGILPIIRMSKMETGILDENDLKQVIKCAKLNTIIEFKGPFLTEQSGIYQKAYAVGLTNNLLKIKRLFDLVLFDHIVVPGGIYKNSGLYVWAGKQAGVRVATYDSGEGLAQIGIDDVAAYQMDVSKIYKENVFDILGPWREKAISLAQNEFKLRIQGKDRFSSQTVPYKQTANKIDIVIPLNIDWDAADLGMYKLFDDSFNWVAETVQYVLEETTATIAIRQHPAERMFDSSFLAQNYFINLFGGNPRVYFFSSEDPVNTYSLIENAILVLPHVSTVGIEAAILGKEVVLESNCYYSDMPFVKKATTKSEYFEMIKQSLENPRPANIAHVGIAWLSYYFTQLCSYLPTCFTPQPKDFIQWVKRSLPDLVNDDAVKMIFTSISQQIPIALMQSEKLIGKIQAQTTFSNSSDLQQAFSNVSFGNNVQIIGIRNVSLGEGSCISDDVWLNVCVRDMKVRMKIGQCTLIGRQSMVSTGGYLEIGDYCVFAPRVYVSDADHVFADVRTPIIWQGATTGRSVIVEENCWLGVNAVVSGNITVGRGSVVAANSVVLDDVPPFCVVAGIPARIVKIFNSQTKQWEKVQTLDEQEQLLALRAQFPIPDRTEYKAILRQNAVGNIIDPIIAGRGISI